MSNYKIKKVKLMEDGSKNKTRSCDSEFKRLNNQISKRGIGIFLSLFTVEYIKQTS